MPLRRPRGHRDRPVAIFRGTVTFGRFVPLGLGYLSVAAGDLTVRWQLGRTRFGRERVKSVEVHASRRVTDFRFTFVDGSQSRLRYLPATPFGAPEPSIVIATLRQLNWDVHEV